VDVLPDTKTKKNPLNFLSGKIAMKKKVGFDSYSCKYTTSFEIAIHFIGKYWDTKTFEFT